MARCSAITAAGARCKVVAITGSEWCHGHHPDRAAARHRSATRAAKRGGRGRPSTVLLDIQATLDELVEQVLAGELDQGKASICGQLLNYKTAAVRTALKAREQEELEQRLVEVETILAQRKERASA